MAHNTFALNVLAAIAGAIVIITLATSLFFNWRFYITDEGSSQISVSSSEDAGESLNDEPQNGEVPVETDLKVIPDKVQRYWGEALQIGGPGSRLVEKTAGYLDEHGYLSPADDWVGTFFNGPAYLMHVSCRDGYDLTKCSSGTGNKVYRDKFTCSVDIEEKIQNKASIECGLEK